MTAAFRQGFNDYMRKWAEESDKNDASAPSSTSSDSKPADSSAKSEAPAKESKQEPVKHVGDTLRKKDNMAPKIVGPLKKVPLTGGKLSFWDHIVPWKTLNQKTLDREKEFNEVVDRKNKANLAAAVAEILKTDLPYNMSFLFDHPDGYRDQSTEDLKQDFRDNFPDVITQSPAMFDAEKAKFTPYGTNVLDTVFGVNQDKGEGYMRGGGIGGTTVIDRKALWKLLNHATEKDPTLWHYGTVPDAKEKKRQRAYVLD